MNMNSVIISGNLTRDMEIRQTANGHVCGVFGIAVNDRRRDANGNWIDNPNFFDCSMFGDRAANIAQYMTKGAKVCISGKLKYSQWETEAGKRSRVEIIVNDVDFMTKRENASSPAPVYQNSGVSAEYDNEDIPF